MRILNRLQHMNLLDRNCNKGKHHLRTNKFGVTWCTYCGLLSTTVGAAERSEDNDRLLIICNEERYNEATSLSERP